MGGGAKGTSDRKGSGIWLSVTAVCSQNSRMLTLTKGCFPVTVTCFLQMFTHLTFQMNLKTQNICVSIVGHHKIMNVYFELIDVYELF